MKLPVSSLIQNCNTRNVTIYVIRPRSKVFVTYMNHSKIGNKSPAISIIRSLVVDIPLAFGLEYIYQQTSSDLSLG